MKLLKFCGQFFHFLETIKIGRNWFRRLDIFNTSLESSGLNQKLINSESGQLFFSVDVIIYCQVVQRLFFSSFLTKGIKSCVSKNTTLKSIWIFIRNSTSNFFSSPIFFHSILFDEKKTRIFWNPPTYLGCKCYKAFRVKKKFLVSIKT